MDDSLIKIPLPLHYNNNNNNIIIIIITQCTELFVRLVNQFLFSYYPLQEQHMLPEATRSSNNYNTQHVLLPLASFPLQQDTFYNFQQY